MGRIISAAELAGAEEVPTAAPRTISAAEVEGAEEQPIIGRGKAALATTLQGTTLGAADELGGVGGAIGEGLSAIINQGRLPTGAELRRAYVEERDTARQTVRDAKQEYPFQSFATEVAGGLIVPIPGGGAVGAAKGVAQATKAVGIGRRALQVAKALAPAAATGAVAGVGYQESGEAKVADAGDVLGSAAGGAVAGAAVAGGLKAVGKGLRKLIPKRDQETIKQGIVDQLAQAEGGPRATPTAQKRVSKAADAILDEVVKGPDGEVLHEIIQSPSATKAMDKLRPLLDRVEAEKQTHYDRFVRAQQHVLDVPKDVSTRLKAAEQEFRRAGDSRMADGLEGIREKLLSEADLTAQAGGATDMRWLRKHVTTLQDAAASKLGGLNEHEKSRISRHIAGEAKDVLDQVIDAKAVGRNDLQGAAAAIRRLNRRQYAYLSVQGVLENRAEREAAQGGPIQRAVNQVTGLKAGPLGAAGAAIGAAAGGAPGAAAGLALSAVPALARKADRWLNAQTIERLRAAATGASPASPSATISAIAAQLNVPERQVRAAYIRLLVSNKSEEARAE